MAKRFLSPPNWSDAGSLKFGDATFDQLNDFLINLNKSNAENLNGLTKCSGCFKQKRLIEFIFAITRALRLDPLVAYHAVELLQRFMVRHLTDQLSTPTPPDAICDAAKDEFPLIVFACVQLASKLSFHSQMIDNAAAVRFLHSAGHSVSKRTVLQVELLVLKGLDFRLNVLNPLTYIEILLEVLGHNDPSVPVERLHHLCRHVLRLVTLERRSVYERLLLTTLQRDSASREQREMFVSVTEDCMLLGVGVITVAAFILHVSAWKRVVGELNNITGISTRSIQDFARVTLEHIVNSRS